MASVVAYMRARTQARLEILRLLPLAGPRLAVTAVVANTVSGLSPVGFIVATSVMIGRLPAAIGDGWDSPDGRAVLRAIIAAGGFLVLQQTLAPLLAVLGERIGRRVDAQIRDSAGPPAARTSAAPGKRPSRTRFGGRSRRRTARPGR